MHKITALLLLLAHPLYAAELSDQAMTVAFDRSELDLRNDMHQLHGNVRITQGVMSIAAEEATAVALQTDDSRWKFEGSVHMQTADADLKSDVATAEFAKGVLRQAVATGTPALFEQRGADNKLAHGRAGQIEYDLAKGIIRLTNDVWFSYGENEFRGQVVIYNVREQRVVVNPEGKSNGRVNITIHPRAKTTPEQSGTTPSLATENGA
jgi:lipopolysaccharide transport protein LptA